MKKQVVETSVGVFVLLGLICVGYLTIKLGKMEMMGSQYYHLKAKFTSVSGLKNGSAVELAGVQIGQVEELHLDTDEMVAIVTLKIRPDVPLTEDIIASVKTSGLIGDKYINILPGGSDVILKDGDQIYETESAIDLEALLSKYAFGNVDDK